jgi:hypothetical protein
MRVRGRRTAAALAAATFVAVCAVAAAAAGSGGGVTALQLQGDGWTCVLVPVENLLHCRNPGSEPLPAGPTELNFLLFDASGTVFLGTEHLIRFDLYHEQPCNGTPVGRYEFVGRGPGYYACHHFTLPSP